MSYLQNIRVQAIIVFLIAILQYSNTANHDYAWDDAIVLTENTRVQKGLKNIPELFENIKTNETQNRYGYRPIALVSFATDVQLFGMDSKAAHRVNILLYGFLSVIVLLFLNRLFPDSSVGNLLVSLLFVVHPLHTEVVANIKSRDEILAIGFGLLSLLVYCNAISGGRWWHYLLSLILLIFGFLSKESAVTFIGIAFVLPWILFDVKDHVGNLKKSLPLIGFFIVILVIRTVVYSDWFFESNDFELQEKGLFLEDGYVGNPLFDADISGRLATAIFLVMYFLYRFFMPYPLIHDYSYNQFSVQSFESPQVWLAIVVILGLIGLAVYGLIKKHPFGIGMVVFLLSSSIYLHIVQIAPDIFAERFLFVPSLGICIALLSVFKYAGTKKWAPLVIAVVLVPLFGYSINRNGAWKDNRTLLETDLPRLENCVRANYNYALMLHRDYYTIPEFDEYRRVEAANELLHYYERTFELTDRLFNVYMDLGAAYMEFGYPDKAKKTFELAIEKYPYLSAPYVQMGKYYMSFAEYSSAIPYMKHAIRNGERNSDYYYLLAICLFNSGWVHEATDVLTEGERLGTSSSAYYDLMARLFVAKGEKNEAVNALTRGLEIYPNDAGLQQRMSVLLVE